MKEAKYQRDLIERNELKKKTRVIEQKSVLKP